MAIKVPFDNLVIHDAKITYRNFAGNEGIYNPKGARNFAVIIDTLEQAQALEDLGWKVKYSKVREDGEPARFPASLPVHVKYHPKMQPPRVKLLKRGGQVGLDEEAVDVLDYIDIEKVDLIIRPYHWKQPNGSEGVKNMLVSIYITVREDELELKYANVPELGANGQLELEAGEDVWEDLGEIQTQREIEAGF